MGTVKRRRSLGHSLPCAPFALGPLCCAAERLGDLLEQEQLSAALRATQLVLPASPPRCMQTRPLEYVTTACIGVVQRTAEFSFNDFPAAICKEFLPLLRRKDFECDVRLAVVHARTHARRAFDALCLCSPTRSL